MQTWRQIDSVGNENIEERDTAFFGVRIQCVSVAGRLPEFFLMSDNGCEKFFSTSFPGEIEIAQFAKAVRG